MSQSEIIFSVQESPQGGYEARALGYSIFTQADTLDELKTMVRMTLPATSRMEVGPAQFACALEIDRDELAKNLFER